MVLQRNEKEVSHSLRKRQGSRHDEEESCKIRFLPDPSNVMTNRRYQMEENEEPKWKCEICGHRNSQDLEVCEECGSLRDEACSDIMSDSDEE